MAPLGSGGRHRRRQRRRHTARRPRPVLAYVIFLADVAVFTTIIWLWVAR